MEATANANTPSENSSQNFFTGSVPFNYDKYMGPVLFTPYAKDIAARINANQPTKVLELAAGTGRVTTELIKQLPAGSQLTSTDISTGMLEVAKAKINHSNISWEVADMMQLPYDDEAFDIVVCGFGLMFVPDKIKALTEMRRVLKTGGQLLLNTWGNLEENPMWQMGFKTIKSFLGDIPFPKDSGPFALTNEDDVLSMMHKAGFANSQAKQVRKTSVIQTAALAAESFLMTSPALAKEPSLFAKMHEALTSELAQTLGDNPLHTPLLALVFEAIK